MRLLQLRMLVDIPILQLTVRWHLDVAVVLVLRVLLEDVRTVSANTKNLKCERKF